MARIELLVHQQPLCPRGADLPELMFRIGEYEFNLTADDYIWQDGNYCTPLFLPVDPDEGYRSVVRLGSPFLRRWLSVYDFENRTVSLAMAKSTKIQER
jgi:hypothetical protein